MAKNLVLTPAIKQYIEDKINSLPNLVKRFERQRQLIVRFELARTTRHHHKGLVYYAEANIHLPGRDIRAEATAESTRAAVDQIKKSLKTELQRYKEKLIARR